MTMPSSPESMLKQIAQIRRMERGKLCLMRQGPTGPYYSHQTWVKGRNVVRYVPRDRAEGLQNAIAGYRDYLRLTEAYADLIIARTRQEQAQPNNAARSTKSPSTRTPEKSPELKIHEKSK